MLTPTAPPKAALGLKALSIIIDTACGTLSKLKAITIKTPNI